VQIRHERWYSPSLGQDMELKIYGSAGKPAVVFPAEGGRFFEYEDFGMVGACAPFLEAGKLQLYTVDSVDRQAWSNQRMHPRDRARRHNQYERYIVDEVVPFIHERTSGRHAKLMTTGCSMGGYHSANFFFRHPRLFDTVLAVSGVFRLKIFIGDYMDEEVYYHAPLAYLPGLDDPGYLEQYRQSQIVVSVGQGAWEDEMLGDARRLQGILERKQVPCWVDVWGHDVSHDWPWWRIQVPYFLRHLKL
jgi:esterase/lipase superfamily enzyme